MTTTTHTVVLPDHRTVAVTVGNGSDFTPAPYRLLPWYVPTTGTITLPRGQADLELEAPMMLAALSASEQITPVYHPLAGHHSTINRVTWRTGLGTWTEGTWWAYLAACRDRDLKFGCTDAGEDWSDPFDETTSQPEHYRTIAQETDDLHSLCWSWWRSVDPEGRPDRIDTRHGYGITAIMYALGVSLDVLVTTDGLCVTYDPNHIDVGGRTWRPSMSLAQLIAPLSVP